MTVERLRDTFGRFAACPSVPACRLYCECVARREPLPPVPAPFLHVMEYMRRCNICRGWIEPWTTALVAHAQLRSGTLVRFVRHVDCSGPLAWGFDG